MFASFFSKRHILIPASYRSSLVAHPVGKSNRVHNEQHKHNPGHHRQHLSSVYKPVYVRYPRLKTWACSQPPPQFISVQEGSDASASSTATLFCNHATGPSDNWPVLAQYAEQGAFLPLCRERFRLFACRSSARRVTVVSSNQPPSDGGVVALR